MALSTAPVKLTLALSWLNELFDIYVVDGAVNGAGYRFDVFWQEYQKDTNRSTSDLCAGGFPRRGGLFIYKANLMRRRNSLGTDGFSVSHTDHG